MWAVFQEFEAPDYTPQGIEEFRKFISYRSVIAKFEKEELSFWGGYVNRELVGVIATRGLNHICLLFVKKEFHRQGFARRLVQKVVERCAKECNTTTITVNSSPYAIEFYHRLGFIDTDIEQNVNGMRFTPMSYTFR